jgi:DNA-directed RNA polymerase specialized sigma24 family protein
MIGGPVTTKYTATARREGRWWTIAIPEVGAVTQARRAADVEWMARECVALTLDVPDSAVAIDVQFALPDDTRAEWEQSRALAEHARQEAAEAARLARQVVARMRSDGYTYAEMASVLGLSAQRVHQLSKAA